MSRWKVWFALVLHGAAVLACLLGAYRSDWDLVIMGMLIGVVADLKLILERLELLERDRNGET